MSDLTTLPSRILTTRSDCRQVNDIIAADTENRHGWRTVSVNGEFRWKKTQQSVSFLTGETTPCIMSGLLFTGTSLL